LEDFLNSISHTKSRFLAVLAAKTRNLVSRSFGRFTKFLFWTGGRDGRGRPRRAGQERTDCRHASGGADIHRMCFLAGGRWRAWRNVHRERDPGRAVPREHPGWACWGWADEGGGGGSLPLTRGCIGGSSEPAWAVAAALAAPPPIPRRGSAGVPGLQKGGW
jgi:hypothetical protein